MADIVLNIKLNGQQLKATASVAEGELKKLRNEATSVTDTISKWSMIVTGFNQALSIATRVGNEVDMLVNKYAKQEAAERKVQQAILTTGNAAKLSSQELIQFAADLQNKTTFGDETILNNATAQLLTFTKIASDNFKKAQKAALDIATVITSSPEEAESRLRDVSIQLGKALNDPVGQMGALSRAGIMFSDQQKKVIKNLAETNRLGEAQAIMLKEINKQYGGQAEAMAKLKTGEMVQAENQIGDSLEKIGKIIANITAPAMHLFSGMIKETVGSLDSLFNPIETNLDKTNKKFIEQRITLETLRFKYFELRDVTDKTNQQQEDYKKIIEQLQNLYPDVFKNMDLYKGRVDDVRSAFKKLDDQIIENMRIEARKSELQDIVNAQEALINKYSEIKTKADDVKLEIDLINKGLKDNKQIAQTNVGGGVILSNSKDQLKFQADQYKAELDKLTKEIAAKQDELNQKQKGFSTKELNDILYGNKNNTGNGNGNGGNDPVKKKAETVQDLTDKIAQYQKELLGLKPTEIERANSIKEEINLLQQKIDLITKDKPKPPEIKTPDKLPYEAPVLEDNPYQKIQQLRIDAMQEGNAKEKARLDNWYQQQTETKLYKQNVDAKSYIDTEYANKKRELDRQTAEANVNTVLGSLQLIQQAFGQHTAAAKMAAIAMSLINTYQGATKALATLPPPFSYIEAAATVIAGIAQVNKIRKTNVKGYDRGGRLMPGEPGYFEGNRIELIAPEQSFVDVMQKDLIPQLMINTAGQLIKLQNNISRPINYNHSNSIDFTKLQTSLENKLDNVAARFEAKQFAIKGSSIKTVNDKATAIKADLQF